MATSLSATAQPQIKEDVYGFSGSVGLGVVALPTYEGSPNQRQLVGPVATLSYRSPQWGTVELGQRGVVWQAPLGGPFRLDLIAGIDPGRMSENSSSFNPTPGDERLAGMGTVPSSAEAGLSLGYGPVTLLTRQALGDRGHKGRQVELGLGWLIAVTERMALRVGASVNWADQSYMQAYFGVTTAQAAATPFRSFAPRTSLHKAELSLGAQYMLIDNWTLQGSIAVNSLLGEAAKSPLVARESSALASFALVYAF